MDGATLHENSHGPLYIQLMRRLKEDMEQGKYPAHTKIPSENQLCALYGVSRVTVRKALSILEEEGFLQRHQGKGAYVAPPPIRRDLRHINSFHDACALTGSTAGAKVLSAMMRPPSPEDMAFFSLSEGEEVLEISRLRYCDQVPVMIEINRFPPSYGFLLKEDLTTSLYAILSRHGVYPSTAEHDISLHFADREESAVLNVQKGAALLYLVERVYNQEGAPIHTSRQAIRGDRFTFRI